MDNNNHSIHNLIGCFEIDSNVVREVGKEVEKLGTPSMDEVNHVLRPSLLLNPSHWNEMKVKEYWRCNHGPN
ncbi:2816_t:CDS:2 [Entrophospora sp. SA101]|nr:2816_t:CDS:2 [Entrophospora sp. SA101]